MTPPPGLHRFAPGGWLRLEGEDVVGFLQGQCSQDVAGLPVGRCAYALWLSQKGRVEADSVIFRLGPREYALLSERVPGPFLRERCERFIIADDVTVRDDTAGVEACWLVGSPDDLTSAGLDAALAVGEVRCLSGGVLARDPRREGWRSVWVGPVGAAPAWTARLPDLAAGPWEVVRVEAGAIRIPDDLGPGELPNEGGLETDAISYSKGCYLGQETIARLRSMGQVRRRLFRVRGDGAAPGAPVRDLFQAGRRVGELRSRVDLPGGGFAGFALLALLHLDPQRGLAVEAAGAETIRVAGAL